MTQVTMDERKEDVHRLIWKQVHPSGKSVDLENLFQTYSSNFLTTEFQALYNAYQGMYIMFSLCKFNTMHSDENIFTISH